MCGPQESCLRETEWDSRVLFEGEGVGQELSLREGEWASISPCEGGWVRPSRVVFKGV